MQLNIVRICLLALLSLSLPLAAGAVPPRPMRVINVRSKASPPQTDGTFVIRAAVLGLLAQPWVGVR